MLLGGAGGAADAVAAGAAAQQEDDVAGSRALAAHVGRIDGADHRAYLHALGGIAFVVYLTDVRGRKSYLVAVAGISSGGLAADHALRKLAGDGVGDPGADVAGASDAHRLIDICASGERVADGAAQTGRRAAERLDLRRMVVGLVLELEQPLLLPAVQVYVDVDAAGVVLLTLLEVIELAVGAQPAGSYGGKLHQAEALVLAAELLAHVAEHIEGILELTLHERLVHRNLLNLGSESSMTAVVAPIRIEDAKLSLRRVAAFLPEIPHDLTEIVVAHGQAVGLAESVILPFRHGGKAAQVLEGLDSGFLAEREDPEVLGATLDRVDEIMPYPG